MAQALTVNGSNQSTTAKLIEQRKVYIASKLQSSTVRIRLRPTMKLIERRKVWLPSS